MGDLPCDPEFQHPDSEALILRSHLQGQEACFPVDWRFPLHFRRPLPIQHPDEWLEESMVEIPNPPRNQFQYQDDWLAESMAGIPCLPPPPIPIRYQCWGGFQAESKVVNRFRHPCSVALTDLPGAMRRRWDD